MPSGSIIFRLVGCALAAVPLAAAPTIGIGTVSVEADRDAVAVPILVSGGDAVTDMTAYFQIGDGGLAFGGTPGPKITGIDFTGSIWEGSSGFSAAATFTGGSSPTPTQIEEVVVSLETSGETVAASGLLCTLILDTEGFAPGETFELKITNAVPPDNVTTTEFTNAGAPVPANLSNGTLVLTDASAPVEAPALSVELANGAARLSFDSVNGVTYTIEWNPGLTPTGWTTVSPSISGDGTRITWTDDGTATGSPVPVPGNRFYRVTAN